VALYAQTGANGYIGNYSSSPYNAMLASVRKRYSNNLPVDIDWSYAPSIDNQSNIINDTNQFTFSGQGLICDLTDLRKCRANSRCDARHMVSANYVHDLPIGRGQRFLGSVNAVTSAILGGWSTSGMVIYARVFHSTRILGRSRSTLRSTPPAVFSGESRRHAREFTRSRDGFFSIFRGSDGGIGAFSFPFGGDTGTRNPVHGPGYANAEIAASKNSLMPWSEQHKLQLRWEAFSVFNHVNFAVPRDPTLLTNSNNILNNPTRFGVITSTSGAPRQIEFSLRYDF
jgi:hypothetical protein